MKILYFDGFNAMHRANIKFDKFKKEDIDDTYSMTYNFFRNLRATIEEFCPDKVFFVLEGNPKFRYEILSSYKANRIVKTAEQQSEKDLFKINKYKIYDILKFLPITTIYHPDYECDDVINTLILQNKEEENIIISNDSDFIQILGYDINVKIYNPFTKKYMEKVNYDYVKFKSLRGDASDNIPGIPGIGPKKAEKLLLDSNFPNCLSSEENEIYQRNIKLISFAYINEEFIVKSGRFNLDKLKDIFNELKFESFNEKYLSKIEKTFNKLS